MFEAAGHSRPLIVKRHPRAKGLRLRVDPRDGRVLLTMPKRGSMRKAHAWVETKRSWVEAEIAKLSGARPVEPGVTIPFRGGALEIDWREDRSKKPVLDGDRLLVGGVKSELGNRITRWLKRAARAQLQQETAHYADLAGVTVERVSIGDARTRWGSCSSSGTIRYSWRLILGPKDVLSATVAHEVAHRVHMNHSAEFHALVAKLFGRDPRPERRWLKDHGASLYRVGCSS